MEFKPGTRLYLPSKPRPHRWEECFPAIINARTGKYDPNDADNRAIQKLFKTLPQPDRIKFHQYTCKNATSLAHDAVMSKIAKRLEDLKKEPGQPDPNTD